VSTRRSYGSCESRASVTAAIPLARAGNVFITTELHARSTDRITPQRVARTDRSAHQPRPWTTRGCRNFGELEPIAAWAPSPQTVAPRMPPRRISPSTNSSPPAASTRAPQRLRFRASATQRGADASEADLGVDEMEGRRTSRTAVEDPERGRPPEEAWAPRAIPRVPRRPIPGGPGSLRARSPQRGPGGATSGRSGGRPALLGSTARSELTARCSRFTEATRHGRCAGGGHPSAAASAAAEGAMSGRRSMRKEVNSPSPPATIGMSSATCSARFVESVLILRISS